MEEAVVEENERQNKVKDLLILSSNIVFFSLYHRDIIICTLK